MACSDGHRSAVKLRSGATVDGDGATRPRTTRPHGRRAPAPAELQDCYLSTTVDNAVDNPRNVHRCADVHRRTDAHRRADVHRRADARRRTGARRRAEVHKRSQELSRAGSRPAVRVRCGARCVSPRACPGPTKEATWAVTQTSVPSGTSVKVQVTSPVESGSPPVRTVSVWTTDRECATCTYSMSPTNSSSSGEPQR